jgi:hypothetical protein
MAKASNITTKKRFVISKKMVGLGLTIEFTNKKGETHSYEHDKVFEVNKARLEAMPCFEKYGNYTNSNALPSWAK